MDGFARLHESMAMRHGKSANSALNPISENPSNSTEGSRKFKTATGSYQKHPAPAGGSHSSYSATRDRPDETDSDELLNKNSSFSSYRPNSSAARDDGVATRRPGSPRPAESSSARRTRDSAEQRSSNLSPRSSLRVPADGAVDGASGSGSLNRRSTRTGRQTRHFDTTDNMRIDFKDDSSSSDNDGTYDRSRRQRQAASQQPDPDVSQRSSRHQSRLRDDSSSLSSRRRNLDSKHSDDDGIPEKRGSHRAALKPEPESRDDFRTGTRDDFRTGTRELETGRDREPFPLRSTSRELPLNRRNERTSMSSKDDISDRRRKVAEDDSDPSPSRVAVPRRDNSPLSGLSPRNESHLRRKKVTDERSESSFSRRKDLSSTSSDGEERNHGARSRSPPVKSPSRVEPVNRLGELSSRNNLKVPVSPRKGPLDDGSESRRNDSLVRMKRSTDDQDDSRTRRKNAIDDNDDSEPRASDNFSPHRRNTLELKRGRASSPPLKSSSGNDFSPSRSNSLRDSSSLRVPSKVGLPSRYDRSGSSDGESSPLNREDSLENSRRPTRDSSSASGASKLGYRSSSSLSPGRRDEPPSTDDNQKKAGARPKSGIPKLGEASVPRSRFQGDKEQPKSGALRRPVPLTGSESPEKKSYGQEISDSEISSETKDVKGKAVKSPLRVIPGARDRKSLSPPSVSKISPRGGKSGDSFQSKTESDLKPRESEKDNRKGLSPRAAAKDDSKKELSYLKSGSKSPRQYASPPRTAEQKSLKSPTRLTDRKENKFVKSGIRDESARLGSKGPAELDFSRYEAQRLRIVKLKRRLPANLSGTRYLLVEEAATQVGFGQTKRDDFSTPFLIWNDTFISTERLTQLKPFQRVNHFPGMAEICRKDLLAKNMDKLYQRYPNEYRFVPRTWCLPDQLAKFRQHVQESKSEVKPSYICKPADGASGRGIKIYKTADEVPQSVDSESVLQEYVSNPFLIENVKFDLRLYVLITSCDPLRIYLFNDGFLRMSSEPYVDPQKCKSDDELAFMHLTNCSVNKQNRPNYQFGGSSRRKDASISGMKRPLMFLNTYLQQNKYDVAKVWRNIVDLIIKTVLAAYPHIVRSYRQCRPSDSLGSRSACFELLGFDVLLDAELKPWLLEVNRSPSFDSETSNEKEVKLQLLEETLMLLNFSPADWKAAKQTAECPPVPAKTAQKEVAELTALLARLKRQDRMKDSDARVCQRFRRIFPVEDAAKQEKLVSLMLDAISALLEGSQMEALHRETKTFHASKTDDVAKKLAQLGPKTVQQLMAEGQAASSDSGSEAEDQAAVRRRVSKPAAGRLSSKDIGTKSPRQRSLEKRKDLPQKQPQTSESIMASEREQLAQRTLKFLNELSIRFPGKSHRGAEQLLRQLQSDWRARKADVSSYWRLSLDADKRRKVIDIAKRNVRVALDKALRMTAADVTEAAERLARLFEKLYNRLLWCHGQGLWETFGGHTGWEKILRQSRKSPTDTEINCCRRVVQLCQDCLLVVYLFSDTAQQLQKQQLQEQQQQQQQQQRATEQLSQKSPLTVS